RGRGVAGRRSERRGRPLGGRGHREQHRGGDADDHRGRGDPCGQRHHVPPERTIVHYRCPIPFGRPRTDPWPIDISATNIDRPPTDPRPSDEKSNGPGAASGRGSPPTLRLSGLEQLLPQRAERPELIWRQTPRETLANHLVVGRPRVTEPSATRRGE